MFHVYDLDLSVAAAILAATLLVCEETAFRFGRRAAGRGIAAGDSVVGTMQSALLALLGLMLAFTFSMANSRFEARKALLLEEANDIGTTWLRTSFLPEPERTRSREILKSYVGTRIRLYDDLERTGDKALFARFLSEAGDQHRQLWQLATESEKASTSQPLLALYVDSLNAMIDVHASRIAAARNQVPEIALLLVFALCIGAAWTLGHSTGLAGRRSFWSTTAFHLLVVLVIVVIMDIDRPLRGSIRVVQTPLLELQRDLEAAPN